MFSLGALALHGKGIGIVHIGRFKPHQTVLRIEAFHRLVRFLRRHAFVDVVEDDQRGAGILPGHINLLVDHRVTRNHRCNIGLRLYLKPFLLQILHGHGRENVLLGKALCCQDQRRGERLAGEERGGA